MQLLNSDHTLNDDDREFIYEHFHPGAEHNITESSAYFTPTSLATDLAAFNYPSGEGDLSYLDACAGIGALSWALIKQDRVESKIKKIVAVESNPQFVAIGKRLLPEVTWVQGSIFDLSLLKSLGGFDIGISNPPYGPLPTRNKERSWLKTVNPAHLSVAEVLIYLCKRGAGMIIPASDHNQEDKYPRPTCSTTYEKFINNFPQFVISPEPVDCSAYSFHSCKPKISVVDICTRHGNDNPHYLQLP